MRLDHQRSYQGNHYRQSGSTTELAGNALEGFGALERTWATGGARAGALGWAPRRCAVIGRIRNRTASWGAARSRVGGRRVGRRITSGSIASLRTLRGFCGKIRLGFGGSHRHNGESLNHWYG